MSRETATRCDACDKLLFKDDHDSVANCRDDFVTFHFYAVSRMFYGSSKETLGGVMHTYFSCPNHTCACDVLQKVQKLLAAETKEIVDVLAKESTFTAWPRPSKRPEGR